MSIRHNKKIHRPFDCLKDMLDRQDLPDKKCRSNKTQRPPEEPWDPSKENRIFQDAMIDVKPISRVNCPPDKKPRPAVVSDCPDEEMQVLMQLKGLVQNGTGFVIADTAEYIEGSGYPAPPEITTRLHRGDFSIQDHLDLHGLGAAEAEVAFEKFLKACITSGKRAVLIIHGRGLCSPSQPVLKTKVSQWLTRGRWRKWVIAFTSARSCDGGTGASYILLRQRPLTKSQRKAAADRRGEIRSLGRSPESE